MRKFASGFASHPIIKTHGDRRSQPFFLDFRPGSRIMDIGCGDGVHIRELAANGFRVCGVDLDSPSLRHLQRDGFEVVEGTAERLPFADSSFDGIVCSVVIPYTDERAAVAEWARVLVPGGQVRASFHGVGYALKYLLSVPNWKHSFYGFRMFLNTFYYRVAGKRIPGWWGDTLYQSTRRLQRYYREFGLGMTSEYLTLGTGGLPEFIYHHLVRSSGKSRCAAWRRD